MRFLDRVVLVTGASGGIGCATAARFAKEGATVFAHYHRSQSPVQSLVASVESERGEIIPVQADVRDSDAVNAMVQEIVRVKGGLDILVNNAGITHDTLVPMMADHEWEEVMQVNVGGAFRLCRAVARPMMLAKRGRIINISSVAATHGGRGQANYAASKGALESFTRALAVELAPKGILVNAVAPGIIETAMTQRIRRDGEAEALSKVLLNRFGRPEEVAGCIAFLASDDAGYITGATIAVDGGFKMA